MSYKSFWCNWCRVTISIVVLLPTALKHRKEVTSHTLEESTHFLAWRFTCDIFDTVSSVWVIHSWEAKVPTFIGTGDSVVKVGCLWLKFCEFTKNHSCWGKNVQLVASTGFSFTYVNLNHSFNKHLPNE